jgi:hypothetical protein
MTWETPIARTAYTHYTNAGASRIDRIYVTENPRKRKQGAETVAAAFTHHFAVLLHLTFDRPRVMHRTGHLRMNITLLDEPSFRAPIKELWGKWQRNIRFYPNGVIWWDRYVKRMIRQAFQHEGATHNRDRKEMENFYYDLIYQVLRDPSSQENIATTLRKLKAKIVRLHSIHQRGVHLDTEDKDRILGEELTIPHYLKSWKRKMARTIPRD